MFDGMQNLISAVERIDPLTVSGRVAAVKGLLIEARGGLTRLPVGARADIIRPHEDPLPAEVVGFRDTRALLMPFGPVEGVAPGAEIRAGAECGICRAPPIGPGNRAGPWGGRRRRRTPHLYPNRPVPTRPPRSRPRKSSRPRPTA